MVKFLKRKFEYDVADGPIMPRNFSGDLHARFAYKWDNNPGPEVRKPQRAFFWTKEMGDKLLNISKMMKIAEADTTLREKLFNGDEFILSPNVTFKLSFKKGNLKKIELLGALTETE